MTTAVTHHTTRTRTRAVRALVVLAALCGWLLVSAPAAWAHAELVSTTPANGEHLAAVPAELTLKFSEGVNTVHEGIKVLDRSGRQVNRAAARGGGDTVVVPMPSGLKDGVYTVDWRVVSADSHPVHGAFVFSVGDATVAPLTGPVSRSGADPVVSAGFWVFRFGAYAGLALLVGGAFFRIVCWPAGRRDERARAIVRGGWIASVVCAVGSLLLQGPNSTGASVWRAFDPSLLGATVQIDYGVAVLARLVLLGVAAVGLRWLFAPTAGAGAGAMPAGGAADEAAVGDQADGLAPWRLTVLAATAVGMAATWSWAGHAHVGDQAPLAVAADVAHLCAMSVWVGGLALLTACVLPRGRAVLSQAARVLPRFSLCAMVAVGVLVTTGTYRAWREVRSVSALAGSDYGKLLIFKLAAFGILMALAAMSRSAVQRRYVLPATHAAAAQAPPRTRDGERLSKKDRRMQEEQEQTALGALRQSVRLEAGVVLGVLGLTAALVATPPGQVAGAFETAPSVARTPTVTGPFITLMKLPGDNTGAVQVRLDPARAGDNRMVLSVSGAGGGNQDPKDLTAQLSLPAKKIGPLPVTLRHTAIGQYTALTVTVPVSGRWHLDVTVRTSEFDEVTVKTDIPVS